MVTILPRLRQVRKDLAKLLGRQAVEQAYRAAGLKWRKRKLDPWTVLHLFLSQVLHQNTAMTHLPHLSGETFTPSAYCQARQRLSLPILEKLVNQVSRRLQETPDGPLWHGHRLFFTDGSGFSMPDTAELQAYFGQPGAQKPGCGFPVAHLLCLFDAERGFLSEPVVSPLRTHDMAYVHALHPRMQPNDILLGDRGFCSYAHLALISRAGLHAVFRIHQRQIVSFCPHRRSADQAAGPGHPTSRWIQRLGRRDQLVEWRKPASCPKWMAPATFAQLPDTMVVREIRFRVREPGREGEITLVTTLLDPEKYPAAEIAALYHKRWQAEVDLRDLKITLGLDVLKGQSVDVVKKEVLVFVLVHNLVRLVAAHSAARQRVHPTRISFVDALRWLQPPKPDGGLPDLVVNPVRRGRIEPRCLKRRAKKYILMKKPRHELRKRLKRQKPAA
jgi:hypothetical protein